ncbi:MAG: fibronectin type III domain-containing protein, partial [Bacteroidetes bacterium]|nr:fibronectin type III domain-containing protein [Bacteroidota bacterium]
MKTYQQIQMNKFLKSYYFKGIMLLIFAWADGGNVWGQLLQQDFESSTTVSDYVSPTPNNGQFNAIGSSNATNMIVSVNTVGGINKLSFEKLAHPGSGSFSRTTDFSPVPNSLIFQLDLTVSGNYSAQTTAAIFQVGSAFGTANSAEANANIHSRFGLNFTSNPGEFSLREIGNGTNTSIYSGTRKITFVINNSGATINYLAPNGTIESIGDDKFDLWVGNNKEFDERNATTFSQTLTDIKFIFNTNTGIFGTIDIDNILIDPIPPAINLQTPTNVLDNSLTLNWVPVSGVTGYRVDVSTSPGFATFVSGYENLYLPGSATSNLSLSGLSTGTKYYYRIRAVSEYTLGSFSGAFSDGEISTTIQNNWQGNFSSNWNLKGNWALDSVPQGFHNITIPSSPTNQPEIPAGFAADCYNLIIDAGASLSMAAGAKFNVNGNLENNGTLTVKSDATGQVGTVIAASASGTGTTNVEQYLTLNRWWYVSSPVGNPHSSLYSPAMVANGLRYYDEPSTGYIFINDGTTALNPNIGYYTR